MLHSSVPNHEPFIRGVFLQEVGDCVDALILISVYCVRNLQSVITVCTLWILKAALFQALYELENYVEQQYYYCE